MKNRARLVLFIGVLCMLMISCMLPGMIPLNKVQEGPMPYMEKNGDKVLETLQTGNVHSLAELAPEQYTAEDFAKPDTWTYTVTVTDDLPTVLLYGWCAVDEPTLQQNLEHIVVRIYFNGEELDHDVVHPVAYASPDNNMACHALSVLMSDWPEGEYTIKAMATFEEKINDGLDDYEPGDYVYQYNITVKKEKEGANAPSG